MFGRFLELLACELMRIILSCKYLIKCSSKDSISTLLMPLKLTFI